MVAAGRRSPLRVIIPLVGVSKSRGRAWVSGNARSFITDVIVLRASRAVRAHDHHVSVRGVGRVESREQSTANVHFLDNPLDPAPLRYRGREALGEHDGVASAVADVGDFAI